MNAHSESDPKAIHVGLDARCLNTSHLRGMGKYVDAVLSHLKTDAGIEWTLLADRPEEQMLVPTGLRARQAVFDMKGYRYNTWEQLGLPRYARRERLDVLHCTATTLPWWQPVPTVVTIHDTLQWEIAALGKYERWYWHRLIPAAFERCHSIITISQSSRDDIVARWPNLAPRLHVIPHGVSDLYFSGTPESLARNSNPHIPVDPYLLYIGGALERKRFPWALELLRRLPFPKLRLLACGFNAEERKAAEQLIPESLRERTTLLPFVKETDMPALYRHAVGVLYPTLYEGFGLPVVESLAAGTPVLFCALGSLRELQGPGARVLPETDMPAWVQTVTTLYGERAHEPAPDEEARRWARRFSWAESARAHAAVYAQAAASTHA